MKIKFSKTIQERQYEPLMFEIELDDKDVPILPDETVQSHAQRMEFEGQRRLIIFLAKSGRLELIQAREHITDLRAQLGKEDSIYGS